jgi:SAM-dependent methyltransferase
MTPVGTEPQSPSPPRSPETLRDPASYRDPSGFVYRRDGRLLRQINASYAPHWDALVQRGFLTELIGRGLLIPHEPVELSAAAEPGAHVVIAPEPVSFLSYPYEWTFGELRDAALLTLEAERLAIEAGFTLKDASAYNVQFRRGRPILIDTLSFESAKPGEPWIAYRQFCQHFLAPLALMAYRDPRCGLLLRDFIDGLPLDLTSRLLPGRTRLNFGLLSHIHLHARAERRFANQPARGTPKASTASGAPDDHEASGDRPPTTARPRMGGMRLAALIDGLRRSTESLRWEPRGTEWADYAENTSYAEAAAQHKDRTVEAMLRDSRVTLVWDLGANTGRFSRIAASVGCDVLAFDIDPGAAERHYRAIKEGGEERVLPLVADIAAPSPALGWAGAERLSLLDRANADVVLALALVHHLAISRNVPLPSISVLFARLAPEAIVEFVPKADPMVQFLLASREDVFPEYTIEGFRAAFDREFETIAEVPIEGSPRTLFHFRRRTDARWMEAPTAAA